MSRHNYYRLLPGPIYVGYIEANKLKAITLAVIELKCQKNCKILPFPFKLFFSNNS